MARSEQDTLSLIASIRFQWEYYAQRARDWHGDADAVAPYSPRLAAHLRDVARAMSDLAYVCKAQHSERKT